MTIGTSLDESQHAGNPLSQPDKGGVVSVKKSRQGCLCNTTEVVVAGNDVRSEVQNSCFFGCLDILGFKNIAVLQLMRPVLFFRMNLYLLAKQMMY